MSRYLVIVLSHRDKIVLNISCVLAFEKKIIYNKREREEEQKEL